MTKQQRSKYPKQWEALAWACKERDGWACVQCGIKQYEQRVSRKGHPYFVYLHAAHKHQGDTRNQYPELITLCISCHARYDCEFREREKRVALERHKHQKLLASRVDLRFYGG